MSLEIVLINLDRSPDRLAFMSSQFERLGLSFTRLSATDASTVSDEEYARLGCLWFRQISRTELACLLSHSRVWRKSVEEEKSVLVLEDDVFLSNRLPAFLEDIEAFPELPIVNIETRGYSKCVSRAPVGHCQNSGTVLHRLDFDRGGSGAYLIRPAAARDLLSRLERDAAPSDAYLNKRSDIVRYQTDPGLASPFFYSENGRGRRLFEVTFETTIAKPTRGISRNVRQLLTQPKFKMRRLASHLDTRLRRIALAHTNITRPIAVCRSISEANRSESSLSEGSESSSV